MVGILQGYRNGDGCSLVFDMGISCHFWTKSWSLTRSNQVENYLEEIKHKNVYNEQIPR